MRHYRVALVHCLPAFMMCAQLTSTLSCRHEKKLASYLDSLRMVPPIDEPSSFEIVGYRGYDSATTENTLTTTIGIS